ncbi:MAG TPA: PIN domain-containing protein [Thermodesulfobacteriota bacterium]
MKTKSIEAFLERHIRIGLDTSVFIFQLEENPKYRELVNKIFVWLEGPRAHSVTSTVTMLELLVKPYQLSDIDSVNKFYALLSTYPHLEWIAPTLEIADLAAKLRAEYNLRTPDALQVATALSLEATGFISNDTAFQRITDLEILILDELLIDQG